MKIRRAAVLSLSAGLLVVTPLASAHAASRSSSASCAVGPSAPAVGQSYAVEATGLPTNSPLNLFVTDASGNTSGYPLGSSATGVYYWTTSSSTAGLTAFQFTGPVKQNGTTVYASCSVSVS